MNKGSKNKSGTHVQQDPQDQSNFEDKEMNCAEGASCISGGKFVWTAGEQDFFAQKGFDTPPKRCKPCRDRKKANQDQNGGRR